MGSHFVFPDSDKPVSREESKENEYPYWRRTQHTAEGVIMEDGPQSPSLTMAFTKNDFPLIQLPAHLILQGTSKEQKEMIEKNPDDVLAILPFGTGASHWQRQNPKQYAVDVLNFFKTGMQHPADRDGLDIIAPAAIAQDGATKKARLFEGPWCLFLQGFEAGFRDWLVWQQTFAVNRFLTFSVLPINTAFRSWVLITFEGDAIHNTPEGKKKALKAIKEKIWSDPKCASTIASIAARNGAQGNSGELLVQFTNTLRLEFVPCPSRKADKPDGNPFWQLTGYPFATTKEDHHTWLATIRALKFYVGLRLLTVDKRRVFCDWCKSEMHTGSNCPFPRVEGWRGPTHDEMEGILRQDENNASKDDKDKGDPRSPRTKRASEKGPSQGGWQQAGGRKGKGPRRNM